jgi:hypothetical protein
VAAYAVGKRCHIGRGQGLGTSFRHGHSSTAPRRLPLVRRRP